MELTADPERARLVKMYGSEAVAFYEEKFRKWAKTRGAKNAPLYRTIARWLAKDTAAAAAAPTPAPARAPAAKAPALPAAPKRHSSIDTERLRQRVMENYRRFAAEHNGDI